MIWRVIAAVEARSIWSIYCQSSRGITEGKTLVFGVVFPVGWSPGDESQFFAFG
jgi:hypothetical protein